MPETSPHKTDMSSSSWRALLNREYATPLMLVGLGIWLHAADSLLVATMMPAIIAEIGGEAYVAWTVALYEVGSIVAGAASALLVVRHGIRQPMMLGAALFAVGCLISAVAPTMQILLAGRLLQGLGGGSMTAMAFIAVATLFPPHLAARALAAISMVWGASAFLGPLIGGIFTTYATWRWGFVVFAAQAIVLGLWILFGPRITEPPKADAAESLPVRRLALLSLGVLLIAAAGIDVSPVRTPLLLIFGLLMLVFFVVLDGKNPQSRMLPENPFNLRTPVGTALTMVLLMNISIMGLSTYGPLLMVMLHGTPVIVAGYVVACTAIGWTLAAVTVSGAPERHDPYYIAVGMVLVVISIAGMIYAMPHGPIWLIATFAALEGVGYGAAWTFIIRRTQSFASPQEYERLSGALPTVARLGYALGASVSGILANWAGFSISGTSADTAFVARMIFAGSLPIALLALFAVAKFVVFKK